VEETLAKRAGGLCSRLIEMCRFGQIGRDKVLFDAMEQGYRGMKNKDTVLYVAGILSME
jgi:hypothetical protein